MNSIFTRRSVRQFTEQVVESDVIEKLMRAAMQAPSAGNQQPWEFLIVSGKDNLAKLSEYNPYASCLKGANIGIIVLGNTERMRMPKLADQDLGAATQNILLEATELGLGSVWFGTAPDEGRMSFIRKLYALPANLMPYSVIGIGYPKDENANHFIDRYDESRVKYIK